MLALAATLSAQTPDTGTLTGRVTDAGSHLALGGARITVAGTALRAYADQSGTFVLTQVPAGARTVFFSYVGYPDFSVNVTVPAGKTMVVDGTFDAVVTMEAFVIKDSVVGTARAINQQRAADTLTNIVAADEIGRFPDQNAAESMQRIPGVALYRDQGEGRFIVVRGIRPDLNTVQLNGIGITSPDRGARTVPLDVIPSDALGSVEVAKVATPDKEMDGLGGRVDLKTKSAFDSKDRQLQFSAQGQYNNLRHRLSSKFNGTYSDLFNDGKIGVIFSPTWQDRRLGSDNFEVGGPWTLRPVPGSTTGQQAFFNNDLNYREYDLTRTRYGANGAVEFKPDAESLYFVRGIYSHFTDHENRYVTQIPFSEGTLTALTPVGATVTGVRRESKQLRTRTKTQDLYSVSTGAELTRGDWQFDGHAAFSEGKEDKPEYSAIFRKSTRGTDWTYSFADDIYSPVVTQTGGPSISDPAAFNEFNRLRSAPGTGSEKEYNVGANARYNTTLGGSLPAFVKAGAQVRLKEKTQEREQINFAAPASFNFPALAQPQTSDDYGYFTGPRINAELFTKTFIDNQAAFVATRDVVASLQDDYVSNEDVTALYGMAGLTIDQVNLMAGARYEHTQFETRGNAITTTGAATTITPSTRGRNYDNFLPGFYLTWNAAKKTVVRAAWSNTLSRPAFSESALRRSVSDDNRLVTENNPALRPLTSINYDVSVEHYFPSLGVISVAGFYKDIRNFTYQKTVPGGDAATGYDLSTFVNGDSGKILGVEFAYAQQFSFLPPPFDGVGFLANYTATASSARFPSRPGENLAFIGQSKSIGNLAVTYEKHRFFARLALNFRSPRLREDEPLGASAADDRYVDYFKQLDLTTSYKFTRNFEAFVEVLNLTNEPFRVHFGESAGRFVQFEEYDVTANFGLRWKL